MIQYIIRRLLQTIPVLIGVTIVVFLLMHLIPGDAAQVIVGEGAPREQVEQVRESLGLNDPLPVQYASYIGGLLQGDLGTSIRSNRPIVEEVFTTRFWVTLELALYSTILAVFLGLTAGIFSAVKRNSPADIGIMFVALFGLSMPNFWLGLMLIQFFAVDLSWFRPSGWGTWSQNVLPVLTLGTGGAAIIARMTRSSMLEVLNQDYIRTARAKGAKERIVIYRHALKNAMIPIITVIGLEFGGFLSGAVLTETVFSVNGMGRYVITAINMRDYPVVQGTVLILSVMFVLVNLIVDISYRYFNKRIDLN
ncbi:ABC transporter permease [Paenibacillus senegalensis]|uniref:ABC transporter permease n=1 Tax=Paenibacillus senegalensis TaxID=1465766 RepID=UPI000287DE7B|nr:ABC transporter permease [Paenibacillus senegalensis]